VRSFKKEKIPFPLGYEKFALKGERPVALEIGAGVGWHAMRWSQAHSDYLYLAVEHSKTRFEGLVKRWERHGQPAHLIPIHADAESFVTHCLPAASLDKIFILYPNPYPKESQANKRWHRMPFMEELLKKLKAQGEIEFATNEFFYAEEFRRYLKEQWSLRELEYRTLSKALNPEFRPRTHFEKKYWLRGQELFLCRFAL
jgi:tRNA (guanine-N7-)-methyltransferase